MYLVKSGVPWDVAFSMSEIDQSAAVIVFGQLDGQKFNWGSMRFEEPGKGR